MQFKNVQEEEESGSDWDDLTPHNSPKYSQSSQLHEPSPQHSPSSAAHSPPSQPLLPIARSSHATVSFVKSSLSHEFAWLNMSAFMFMSD